MITPETDLFYQPLDSPEWELFGSIYTFHQFSDVEKLVKAYLGFFDYLAIANAILTKQSDTESSLKRYIKQGVYGTYYLLHKGDRTTQNALMAANPDLPRILSLWNLLENKYL